jgi:hypothetical protein
MPPDGKTSHGLQPVEQKKKNEVKYVMMKFIENCLFPPTFICAHYLHEMTILYSVLILKN